MLAVVNERINEAQDVVDSAAPAAADTTNAPAAESIPNAPAESATKYALAAEDKSNVSAAEHPRLCRQFAYYKKILTADKEFF